MANGVVTFFLVIAIVHACSYFIIYMITLAKVFVNGEKSNSHPILTRIVALMFMLFYATYNGVVYYLLFSIINWTKLFVEKPWVGSIFDHHWAAFLFYEPMILLLTTWFKIFCASDAWRRSPHEDEVMSLLRARVADKSGDMVPLPSITVVMPIYNEPIETLMIAISSVVASKYPKKRLHLVMAFDDDKLTLVYRAVIYCLTNPGITEFDYEGLSTEEGLTLLGVSAEPKDYPLVGDIQFKNLVITPCRFPHGGKRHAQMCAFRYLENLYATEPVKPLLLFIDSDIELHRSAMAHFVYDMNRHKGINREALTGLITCKTASTYSFWKVLQDAEYIESQMLQRNTEDYLGSVSCLPGALTMVRFESLANVADTYFGSMDAEDNFDFNRTHLGEDRYLTHLLMEARREKYRVGFCPAARCKTEGCESLKSLMKQRRRWYLGTLTNEIYMLTSPVLWWQFPALNILIALSALKNGPLFVYVFLTEALLNRGTIYTIGFAILIFVPIWLFVSSFAMNVNRWKVIWGYPLVLLFLPILSAIFQMYGMMTFRERTWGGPRAATQDVAVLEPQPAFMKAQARTARRDANVAGAI